MVSGRPNGLKLLEGNWSTSSFLGLHRGGLRKLLPRERRGNFVPVRHRWWSVVDAMRHARSAEMAETRRLKSRSRV